MTLPFLHVDDRLVAVDKPAGMPVIPPRPAPGSLAADICLRDRLAAALGGPVWVVHRLDRDTSGVVVFARDAAAHRALCLQFEGRSVEKIYDAVVAGVPSQEAGTIDAPLRSYGSGREGVSASGKPATTHWRVLRRGPAAAGLEVRPLTGRRHQIRVHLFHIGHPVLGDVLYGRPRPVGGAPRLMLHARRLTLRHPSGGAWSATAPTPDAFSAWIDAAVAPDTPVQN